MLERWKCPNLYNWGRWTRPFELAGEMLNIESDDQVWQVNKTSPSTHDSKDRYSDLICFSIGQVPPRLPRLPSSTTSLPIDFLNLLWAPHSTRKVMRWEPITSTALLYLWIVYVPAWFWTDSPSEKIAFSKRVESEKLEEPFFWRMHTLVHTTCRPHSYYTFIPR